MVFFWQNEVPVLGKSHGCNIHFRFYDVSVWNLNNFPTSELAIVSLVFLWRCFFFKEFVCDQVSEFDVGTILLSSTAQLPFAFLFNLRSNLRSNWCKSRSGNPWLGQQSLRDGLLVLLHTLCEYGFQLRDDLLVLQIHPFYNEESTYTRNIFLFCSTSGEYGFQEGWQCDHQRGV